MTGPTPPVAQLLVSRVVVQSFRCLRSIDLTLDSETTLIVGENNSGKSSLLLALATALGRRRGSTDDLWRDANGSLATEATIDIFLTPPEGQGSFTEEMAQRLIAVQRDPTAGHEIVGIRTTLKQSGEGSLLVDQRSFLQPQVGGTWTVSPTPPFHPRVLDLLDTHLVDASRDLVAEMGMQTSSWGRLLSDLRIPDLPDISDTELHPKGRRGLEQDLRTISRRLRDASPVLTRLTDDLSSMASAQATVGRVDLVPLPLRLEEIARATEIVLHQENAPELPLRFHGLGSRSLAALLVFHTMCDLKAGADLGIRPHILTLIEEPEAHLHPHAVASLLPLLDAMPGQRVIATHSTTLAAEAPPSRLRLFRRLSSQTHVARLDFPAARKALSFRRYFGRPHSDLFFARLVILADGPTEEYALPILLGMALKTNAAGLGITVVGCDSMSDRTRVNRLLGHLHHLQVPWLCYADNDEAGLAALAALTDPQDGARLTVTHPSVVLAPGRGQTESLLVEAGYLPEIVAVAASAGRNIEPEPDACRAFLTAGKPWAAEHVARLAQAAGKSAPPGLDVLVRAIGKKLGVWDRAPGEGEGPNDS